MKKNRCEDFNLGLLFDLLPAILIMNFNNNNLKDHLNPNNYIANEPACDILVLTAYKTVKAQKSLHSLTGAITFYIENGSR